MLNVPKGIPTAAADTIRVNPFGRDRFDQLVEFFTPCASRLAELEPDAPELNECKKYLKAGGVGWYTQSGSFHIYDMMVNALRDRHYMIYQSPNWIDIRP